MSPTILAKAGVAHSGAQLDSSLAARELLDRLTTPGSGPAPAVRSDGTAAAPFERPPHPGALRDRDGHWYVRDAGRPGKYLRVVR